MIVRRWLRELDAMGSQLATWKPDNGAATNIRQEMLDFVKRFRNGLGRLEVEVETRQEQENQIETALCHAEDAVSVTTSDGRIRLVNPAFERLTGYSGPQIIGLTHEPVWRNAPSDALAEMKIALALGRNWRGEMNCLTLDGRLLVTEISAAPIVRHDGCVTHHVFVQRDITDRVLIGRKVAAQRDFMEKALNLMTNIVLVLGPDGTLKMDNLAAKTLLSDMGADSRMRLGTILADYISGAAKVRSKNVDIELDGGGKRHYLLEAERISAGYLMPELGNENVYLVSLSDISEVVRRGKEALMKQKAISAMKIERSLAQGELACGFAFKVRQPLNVAMAIITRLEDLAERGDTAAIGAKTAMLREKLGEMAASLDDFRNMAGRIPSAAGNCAADGIFDFIEIIYSEKLEAFGARLTLGRPPKDALLPLPEEALQMAVAMLMDNAIESVDGKNGARLHVAFINEGEETGVAIEDNGSGVTEREALRIFEPFYTTKKNRRGISLALVHQIMDKAGGRIEVGKSALGGASFSLRFPEHASP
ncbi:MAG: PAS domain S-box protein [Nitrospinae bacterium]|nr:PAS domain S-box protein [Nitrospinota bacterium]